MTIFSVVRSYTSVLMALLIVSTLAISCKKSGGAGADVDPRDQYIGVYEGVDGSYQSVISFGTADLNPERGKINITITKSANPNEIYVEISGKPAKLTAELKGANFKVIDKTTDQIFVQGTTFDGTYSATGVFGKDQASGKDAVSMTAVTETLRTGTTIRRTESFNGTRK